MYSEIFIHISLLVLEKFKINTSVLHLDSTSISVEGNYENVILDQEELKPIHITYGYSKDHRPDLKQFIMDLICSSDGDVPLFLRVASGNEADKAVFAEILNKFKKEFNLDSLMVADSALYSESNLQKIKLLSWLSRVPLSIKEAKKLVSEIKESEFIASNIEGYRFCSRKSNYGDIPQRWLVVESKSRRDNELKKIEKNLEKSLVTAEKLQKSLEKKDFNSKEAAKEAVESISKKITYHTLSVLEIKSKDLKKNSKKKNLKEKETIIWEVVVKVEVNWAKIELENLKAGRFILATNILDSSKLSDDDMLLKYKEQQAAERGFAFLKDPLFFTSSVFLKSTKRISALALIMGLCLLVYTLAQRHLRQNLDKQQTGIKNQLGKLTNRPTLRGIFQCFQAVHLVVIDGIKQISNLTDERLLILKFFPKACQKYYLI